VDSVTHELRTPLTSIKASVTALLTNSRLQPCQRNDLLMVINEEADRLNRLVGEAVETGQLSKGEKLDPKPHAIEEIIDAARKECQTLLSQRSISVQLPQPKIFPTENRFYGASNKSARRQHQRGVRRKISC